MARATTLVLLLLGMLLACGACAVLLQPAPAGATAPPSALVRSWATIKLMFR